MILNEFSYLKPKSLAEAVEVLSDSDYSKIIAGGQSLIPLMKMGLTAFESLVDISNIPELKTVKAKGNVIEIGSMTRHCDLQNNEVIVDRLSVLAKVAKQIGDPQIRHRGTIGGAIAHGDPASDLAGCFVALRGTAVVLNKNGIREIPAGEFYKGFLETSLGENDLIVSLRFPIDVKDAEFFKVSKRAQDWAISGLVAAKFDSDISLGLISMGSTTIGYTLPLKELYEGFDSALSSIAGACSPTQDIYGTKNYRLHLLKIFLKNYVKEHLKAT